MLRNCLILVSIALVACQAAPATSSNAGSASVSAGPAAPQTAAQAAPRQLDLCAIALQNAVSQDLANRLGSLFSMGAGPILPSWVPPPVIVADPRTNSLIVRATAEDMAKIQELVAQLDRPVQ